MLLQARKQIGFENRSSPIDAIIKTFTEAVTTGVKAGNMNHHGLADILDYYLGKVNA